MQRTSGNRSLKKLNMDDQELIAQVQEGDEKAFEEIVRNYKDKMVNFLWQLTGDYQKANELSQETFMRVYFKAKKIQTDCTFFFLDLCNRFKPGQD